MELYSLRLPAQHDVTTRTFYVYKENKKQKKCKDLVE